MYEGNSTTIVEPLFYRGRGFTAADAVFTIIWHDFSAAKKKINMHLYYSGDIGDRLALQ